jgi:hypothetical protein
MFKKPVDVKTIQRLSGADKKKLRRTAKGRFPQASDADLDAILPPKVVTSFVFPIYPFLLFTSSVSDGIISNLHVNWVPCPAFLN